MAAVHCGCSEETGPDEGSDFHPPRVGGPEVGDCGPQCREWGLAYFIRILRAIARSSSSRSCGRDGSEVAVKAGSERHPTRDPPCTSPIPAAHAPAVSSSPEQPSYPP